MTVCGGWRSRCRKEICPRFEPTPRDLPDLRDDDRVALSGLSHPHSGIASGELVEGYVAAEVIDAVANDYLPSPAADDKDANVVSHVATTDSLVLLTTLARSC